MLTYDWPEESPKGESENQDDDKYRRKVDEIKAKFAERFQILEEANPTQILPVYAMPNRNHQRHHRQRSPGGPVRNQVAERFAHRRDESRNLNKIIEEFPCREDCRIIPEHIAVISNY